MSRSLWRQISKPLAPWFRDVGTLAPWEASISWSIIYSCGRSLSPIQPTRRSNTAAAINPFRSLVIAASPDPLKTLSDGGANSIDMDHGGEPLMRGSRRGPANTLLAHDYERGAN